VPYKRNIIAKPYDKITRADLEIRACFLSAAVIADWNLP
jgi:hypothetical protein